MKTRILSHPAHRALKTTISAATAWLAAQACASAAVVKNLEFNVGPVYPVLEGYHLSGSSSVFTINGGILEQRTYGISGNYSYFFPSVDDYVSGTGPFDSSLPIVLEAKLEILNIEGLAGIYIGLADGDYRYTVKFGTDGILYGGPVSGGLFASYTDLFGEALPDGMQTYRIETSGLGDGSFDFYVDGSLVGMHTGWSEIYNGVDFGDGISGFGNGADANWDYLRVSQLDASSPVPEPGSTVSLALLLAAPLCFRHRRGLRRHRPE